MISEYFNMNSEFIIVQCVQKFASSSTSICLLLDIGLIFYTDLSSVLCSSPIYYHPTVFHSSFSIFICTVLLISLIPFYSIKFHVHPACFITSLLSKYFIFAISYCILLCYFCIVLYFVLLFFIKFVYFHHTERLRP